MGRINDKSAAGLVESFLEEGTVDLQEVAEWARWHGYDPDDIIQVMRDMTDGAYPLDSTRTPR